MSTKESYLPCYDDFLAAEIRPSVHSDASVLPSTFQWPLRTHCAESRRFSPKRSATPTPPTENVLLRSKGGFKRYIFSPRTASIAPGYRPQRRAHVPASSSPKAHDKIPISFAKDQGEHYSESVNISEFDGSSKTVSVTSSTPDLEFATSEDVQADTGSEQTATSSNCESAALEQAVVPSATLVQLFETQEQLSGLQARLEAQAVGHGVTVDALNQQLATRSEELIRLRTEPTPDVAQGLLLAECQTRIANLEIALAQQFSVSANLREVAPEAEPSNASIMSGALPSHVRALNRAFDAEKAALLERIGDLQRTIVDQSSANAQENHTLLLMSNALGTPQMHMAESDNGNRSHAHQRSKGKRCSTSSNSSRAGHRPGRNPAKINRPSIRQKPRRLQDYVEGCSDMNPRLQLESLCLENDQLRALLHEHVGAKLDADLVARLTREQAAWTVLRVAYERTFHHLLTNVLKDSSNLKLPEVVSRAMAQNN